MEGRDGTTDGHWSSQSIDTPPQKSQNNKKNIYWDPNRTEGRWWTTGAQPQLTSVLLKGSEKQEEASSGFCIIDSIIPSRGSTTLILVVLTRGRSEAWVLADTTTSSSSGHSSLPISSGEKLALSFFIWPLVCARRSVKSVLLRESRDRKA